MAWLNVITKLAPFIIQLGGMGVSALPHFTQRKHAPNLEIEDKVTDLQIAELQSAGTQNAEHIRELANDLKNAITTIAARSRRLELLIYCSLALNILLALSVLSLWFR